MKPCLSLTRIAEKTSMPPFEPPMPFWLPYRLARKWAPMAQGLGY
jgi:hypothetical protein